MLVCDCIREIRKIEDAIDALNKYDSGEMPDIAQQHIDEIRELLEHYLDSVAQRRVII